MKLIESSSNYLILIVWKCKYVLLVSGHDQFNSTWNVSIRRFSFFNQQKQFRVFFGEYV